MFKQNAKYEIFHNDSGVHYISSDAEYASDILESIPIGYIDKTVCGCGFTCVALENKENVIIAVPTKLLIKNKISQYPNKRFNYKIFGVDGDVTVDDIDYFIKQCIINKSPIKIMVTYDSLSKLEDFIEKYNFKIIIDESDKIIHYAKLKMKNKKLVTDLSAIDYIYKLTKRYKDRSSFISATPIKLKNLPNWISQIPQYKFKWENTISVKPMLVENNRPIHVLNQDIIGAIKIKGYAQISNNQKIKKIKKVIVFINSVSKIMSIIESTGLSVNEVAIICSKSSRNDRLIAPFKRLEAYDKLPTFTFITSTGFQGVDLDDEEALSIVVSLTTKEYTMLDMNYDMKQAMSRNRNKDNPFYGQCLYIFNRTVFKLSKEELIKRINNRRNILQDVLDVLSNVKSQKKYDSMILHLSKSEEFMEFVTVDDNNKLIINENIFNATQHFIEETRKYFDKGFNIQKSSTKDNTVVVKSLIPQYTDYAEYYKKYKAWDNKIHYNNKYKNIIELSLQKFNKIWLNYTIAKQNVNKEKINTFVINKIIKQIKQNSIKYKNDKIIKVKDAKQIMRSIFYEFNIIDSPKGKDVLTLIKNSKLMNIKLNGKVVNVIRWNENSIKNKRRAKRKVT